MIIEILRRWRFWCWFPWILVIIIIIWCWRPRPCPDTFDADLVIQDETTAAWATTNNTFAGGTVEPEDPEPYWTGILFQLGRVGRAPRKFSSVQFYSGGSLKGELRWDAVAWINIVADVPGQGEPMSVTDYPLLDGTCTKDDLGCDHCRRLHALLEPPLTVVTYWQGPEGFAMEASQSTGPYYVNNEQRFDFKDKFKITCYQIMEGVPAIIPGYVWGVDEIDEIRVTFEPGGPAEGVKQDPPWPGP